MINFGGAGQRLYTLTIILLVGGNASVKIDGVDSRIGDL